MAAERNLEALLLAIVAAAALSACGGGGGGGAPTGSGSGSGGTTTVTVRPGSPGGWLATTGFHCGSGTGTGTQGFVPGPGTPPRGAGSYALLVGTDPQSFEAILHPVLDGTRLDAITALSYSVYVASPGAEPPGVLAPYLTLLVDTTGDGVWDDLLLYMPSADGTVVTGAWQTWDALSGTWCSSSGCGTRAEYLSLHPGARVVGDGGLPGFEVAVGCGVFAWEGFEAAVDAVTVGIGGTTTVYDFEL